MSDLLERITSEAGRNKRAQRVGRGEGSKGKTSGRGQKGAGSRGGVNKRLGFEGGQTEIYRRFPKRGFSNKPFQTKYHAVNLSDLDRFEEGATIDQQTLREAGLIPNKNLAVKILGTGELKKKLTIQAASYSRSAVDKIAAAGGEAQNPAGQPFEFTMPKKNSTLYKRLEKKGLLRGVEAEASQQGGQQPKKDGGKPTEAPEEGGRGEPKRSSGDDRSADSKPTGESGDIGKAPESGQE